MMDDMALRMIGDHRIASYLKNNSPDAVVADRFHVLIWLIGDEKKAPCESGDTAGNSVGPDNNMADESYPKRGGAR